MIEGLKVTIVASELQELCRSRAAYHAERAAVYGQQILSMQANAIEGMQYTNGDPVKALTDKQFEHENETAELTFHAEHLEPGEKYLLDSRDLYRLGITKRGY